MSTLLTNNVRKADVSGTILRAEVRSQQVPPGLQNSILSVHIRAGDSGRSRRGETRTFQSGCLPCWRRPVGTIFRGYLTASLLGCSSLHTAGLCTTIASSCDGDVQVLGSQWYHIRLCMVHGAIINAHCFISHRWPFSRFRVS